MDSASEMKNEMKILAELSPGKHDEVKAVYFIASPETLRRLARFFERCADGIEDNRKAFGHAHLQDFERHEGPRIPDVIVAEME